MGKIGLEMIDGGLDPAAETGQVPVWDAFTGRWVPGDVSGGGGGGTGKDRRWNVPIGVASLDEFNDDALDPAWVRVDGSGAAAGNLTVTEAADSVSLRNNGGDSAATLHALLQPISTMAVGEAFVTCLTITGLDNFCVGGIILADGTTHGSGKQVIAEALVVSGVGIKVRSIAFSNFNTSGALVGELSTVTTTALYLRLVRTATSSWRADISPNGFDWINATAAASQTFTPTHVGFLSTSWGTSTRHIASYEFLRRTA